MAIVSTEIIALLKTTIERLATSESYSWGHMGMCNCGHLAQVATGLSAREIHQRAMDGVGDWGEQVLDYCPTSGFSFDEVIKILLSKGFTISDLSDLETLSNPAVLARLPPTRRGLKKNSKFDSIAYLRAWVELLEEEMASRRVPMAA